MSGNAINGQFPSELWENCLSVWSSVQIDMPKVIRWTRYIEHFKEIRRQNCLQHTFAISMIADMIMIMLEPYVKLDKFLLNRAFAVHDIGEGELNRDVPYVDKKECHDLQEYNAFCRRFEKLPESIFDAYHRAFLLQFCLENPDSFPPEARTVMAELARTKKMEALAFEAIEHWDYFLYALEQYKQTGNGYVLHIVLHVNIVLFDKLIKELPGLKELFWNDMISDWCKTFYDNHDICPFGGYVS